MHINHRHHIGWHCLVMLALIPAQAHAGMVTAGQFRASESGAASYSVPIQLPPGTAGMAPRLALAYSSQAGNGAGGMGWSLQGLSAIGRCPRTLPQDGVRGSVNLDTNDRYCLDGQRLLAVTGPYGANGTEYRTEREGFAKIVSYGAAGNGPAWFKVWTKAGQVMEYGNTADSRIEAQGSATVQVWALNRQQDIQSNYFTVSYVEDAAHGTFYPLRVDYTGHAGASLAPDNSVQFEYQSRPDVEKAYVVGSLVQAVQRLAAIKVYAGSTMTRRYEPAYETGTATGRSRLSSLRECNAAGACLPAHTFTWQEGGRGWRSADGGMPVGWNPKFVWPGDFNGDGKTDLLSLQDDNDAFGQRRYTLLLAKENGGWTASDNPMPLNWNPRYVWTGDFNGDGKTDLVSLQDADASLGLKRYAMFLADGNGGWVASDALMPATWNPQRVWTGDFNGDGKTDLVSLQDADDSFGLRRYVVFMANGTGGWTSSDSPMPLTWNPRRTWTGDFNGDGLTDLVSLQDANDAHGQKRYAMFLATGGGAWVASDAVMPAGWNPKYVWASDFNGDGHTDLVSLQDADDGFGQKRYAMFLCNGRGGWVASDGTMPAAWSPQYAWAGDVNGDGKTDLVSLQEADSTFGARRYAAFVSNGIGGWTFMDGAMPAAWNPAHVRAGDFDGDGKPDLFSLQDSNVAAGTRRYVVFHAASPNPDLLTGVSNGAGIATSVAYKLLTDGSVYTKDIGASAAAQPLVDVQAPTTVVSSVSTSNGVGGTLTTSYRYGGLKVEVAGRGMLGFRWVENTQVDTGVLTRTEYRQDWPFIGMPSKVTKSLAGAGNAGVLSQATYTYACHDFATTGCSVAAGRRYFPYLSQSVEQSWDLNGTALPSLSTSAQYDLWGNATRIDVNTGDGFGKSTVNTYTNDSTNWLLGRLTKATVTSTAP